MHSFYGTLFTIIVTHSAVFVGFISCRLLCFPEFLEKKSISNPSATSLAGSSRSSNPPFFTEIQFFKVHAANECRVQSVTHLFLKKLHGKLYPRNNRRNIVRVKNQCVPILIPFFFTGNNPRLFQIPAKEKGQIQTGTCFGGSR